MSEPHRPGRLHRAGSLLDRASPWIAIGLIVFGIFSLHHTNSRVSRDERQTCMIQSRGLPASKHLASVMIDVQKLLAPVPGEPKPLAALAPILADLKVQVAAYNRLEARQPSGRSC